MSREICPTCQRPLRMCYCSALVHIPSRIKVLIIQHPQEQKHPFNTGRMAHLCLNNSELVVAESLSEATLRRLLQPRSALLYPSLSWLPPVQSVEPDSPQSAALEQLVVIDATWRKSKKMLHLQPLLQQLPRVSFSGELESNYQVRKSSMANSLSTIESIALAMQELQPDGDFGRLLQPFEKMVSLQLTGMQR
ncbi:tRNA-uridine aminocarboxypropyltransferase [Microbulbifer agarilyticus]|uniref:tRNA-uridine aminocarboxypropyltransferase n=1 Tax=Microbulbifer agarilyticus TaxID=260552 RepID=UPI001CD7E481|nr:tRNA-uridine aminocarboxypropyltransferase [Microbulbifer agarilyticus]MCA0894804.1 DTW domain-containing protein [Microbulbifer agarilyticus]